MRKKRVRRIVIDCDKVQADNLYTGLPAIEQFAEAKRLEVEILKK